jgi:hypothetical protein
MSKMDWRKARLHGRRTLDAREELSADRIADAADKWLARRERKAEQKAEQKAERNRQRTPATRLDYDGPPCPRCGVAMEVREHASIGPKQLRKAFYYSRWYCCRNKHCRTTLVMPEEFKVMNEPAPEPETDSDRRLDAIRDQLGERPPWE